MFTERTSLGLDARARSIKAAAIDTLTGELIERTMPSDAGEVMALVAGLRAGHGDVKVTYEAGPTGFELARALAEEGIACQVAAPSKLLRPSGERVKTDRRDAILLARLARNDDIVAVRVPTRSQEGARDLVRSRADARGDLMTARHRLSKMLLRRGIVYDGARTWTRIHDAWLRRVRRDHVIGMGPSALAAFDDAYDTVVHTTARRDRLDEAIAGLYHDGELAPTARRLACLRGVSALTAVSLAVEIGDWSRFKGSTIASYLGLVPSEHSSGTSRSQGPITKTGNTHARRLLIEAAWHHAPAYRPSKAIRARWALAPAPVAERADAGNRRLHARYQALTARGKKHAVVATAIARESAGWLWSLATMDA